MRNVMKHLSTTLLTFFLVSAIMGCADEGEPLKNHAVRKPVRIEKSGNAQAPVLPEDVSTANAAPSDRDEPPAAKTGIWHLAVKRAAYSAEGKIDPFKPLFARQSTPVPPPGPGLGGKPKPPLKVVEPCGVTPLTQVGLEQLKLAAILRGAGGDYALVEDASGKGYVIRKRVCVGIHSGRVAEIRSDKVVVRERYQDVEQIEGEWRPAGIVTRDRELTFPRKNGA